MGIEVSNSNKISLGRDPLWSRILESAPFKSKALIDLVESKCSLALTAKCNGVYPFES